MTDTKIMTLPQAINKYVHKGDSIALGGCTTNRKPYAAVREIIRQGIKELHIENGIIPIPFLYPILYYENE